MEEEAHQRQAAAAAAAAAARARTLRAVAWRRLARAWARHCERAEALRTEAVGGALSAVLDAVLAHIDETQRSAAAQRQRARDLVREQEALRAAAYRRARTLAAAARVQRAVRCHWARRTASAARRSRAAASATSVLRPAAAASADCGDGDDDALCGDGTISSGDGADAQCPPVHVPANSPGDGGSGEWTAEEAGRCAPLQASGAADAPAPTLRGEASSEGPSPLQTATAEAPHFGGGGGGGDSVAGSGDPRASEAAAARE